MKKQNLFKSMLLLCALVAGSTSVWATDVWVKTDIANISTDDYVVVVEMKDTYVNAMTNNPASGKAPSASSISLNTSKTIITSSVAATIQYVVIKTTNGFKLKVPNTSTYVYTTTSNNGIRIGTEATNNHNEFIPATHAEKGVTDYVGFTIKDANDADRYFGVYNNSDWRSYSSFGANIKDQEIALFKKYTTVNATINSTYGWATFSSICPLDFSSVTTLSAYRASAVSASSVTLTQVTGTVAENTGLLLNGTTTSIPVATTGTAFTSSENKLVAVSSAKTLTSANKAYVLTVDGGGNVIFGKVDAYDAEIAAGQAYLDGTDIFANELTFDFGSGEVTGINEVKEQKAGFMGDFYNLAGQRVTRPGKGMYIVNGKKVIIK